MLGRVGWRALLFLAPVLLIGGLVEWVFWRAGECWPAGWVTRAWQKDPGAIYGPRFFTSNIAWIKGGMIRQENPRVIAIGSSRVTQFRAPMFGPLAGSFYNAGHLVTNTDELEAMARQFLRDELPKPQVMIVGLDPWWMKIPESGTPPVAAVPAHAPAAAKEPPAISGAAHLEAMRHFLKKPDLSPALLNPWKPVLDSVHSRRAIGLGALAGNGYRRDGSVLQTNMVQDYLRTRTFRDRETPPVIERIRGHTHQFWVTKGLDWTQADRIVATLKTLRAAGIEVYVVLPPFSMESETALASDPALSAWYGEYRRELPRRLAAEGFACANVHTPADYGMTDEAMLDGFHPGDVLMTWVLENLIRQAPTGSVLRSVPVAGLQELRAKPGVIPLALGD